MLTATAQAEVPENVRDIVSSIARSGRGLVALSGGVDSAVVAWLTRRALGHDAFAVTLVGPSVARTEVDSALAIAAEIGIHHEVVSVDPLSSDEYRSNPTNRCYFCRVAEGSALRASGERRGVRQFLDGIHVDDLGDDRPGIRAMDEAGFRHPLLEVGWRKSDVRAFAREVSLSVADRPSNACLASRIRHGLPLTAALLRTIEAAETAVQAQGFHRVRVRFDGATARVVVGADEVGRLLSEPVASRIRRDLERLGFSPVDLDPLGYPARPGM